MVRAKRVLSFMSEWGGGSPHRRTTSAQASPTAQSSPTKEATATANPAVSTPSASTTALESYEYQSPRSDSRPSSRPMSMIQTYQPPVMEVSQDTLPELQRIFTFLNSHSNKLYQEGYFLKFHDTDARGRPAPDRVWQECFAQLVGTILSLWDASELDRVGSDAEVLPTFINLTDAAIHMMPSMTLADGKKLDNILSISTAASNKYLFHFNSFNSLTQWTAGIRLAMYEHTTLSEAYTGALIAGKGKSLNNIRMILDRQRAKHEDWARVRFGAGTPWRRCWCVITPPDEKEYVKLQKSQKKQNIYDRSPVILKGDMRFYDAKKITKKTRPIATVKEAYAAYAIYPQSKPLIDQSTLVKIEGKIIIHSSPESVSEGFVFVMPETHPAVSGFEIMLRFLFPVFDTFALYGRPNKLISDVLDTRGLMFAMPPDRRYGYLEIWDVVSLIQTDGSQNWTERQWRKELKDLTSKRMLSGPSRSRTGSRRNTVSRSSLPPTRSGSVRFESNGSIRSQSSTRQSSPTRPGDQGARRIDPAPPNGPFAIPRHQRSISETNGYQRYQAENAPHLQYQMGQEAGFDAPPPPPEHRVLNGTPVRQETDAGSDYETPSPDPKSFPEVQIAPTIPPHGPVDLPPSFAHAPSQRPPVKPWQPPPMMKPDAHMDPATLHQLADATNTPVHTGVAVAGAAAAWRSQESLNGRRSGDSDRSQLHSEANARGLVADQFNQNMSSSRSGHSGSRLPTIPASPYVETSEFVESPIHFQPAAPPVPEHAELPQSKPSTELAYRQFPSSGSNQVHRKPVPGRSSTASREEPDNRSTASSSLGSLRNNVIDPEALDSLIQTDSSLLRSTSNSSSRYDDDAVSASSPDYASTISEEAQPRKLPERREERPRSGMLKTIGNPNLNPKPDLIVGDTHYTPDAKPLGPSADIPDIDFGPTYSLAPDAKRPGTSGTMTQALHDSSFSKSRENLPPSQNEQKRQSWFSGMTTPITAAHVRSSSASPQASEDNRSMAWQPGMTSHVRSESRKLDPEEWVAHRAVSPYQQNSPVYTHGRSKSHTPPPMNRPQSGDWSQLQRTPEANTSRSPSRPLSRPQSRGAGTILERPQSRGAGTVLDRPHSRGASAILEQPSSRGAGTLLERPSSRSAGTLLDQRPTSLSARELEQVARRTGTPLLDMSKNPKDVEKESSAGLTAYIDYREKEKAAAKSNRQTAAMQAEIDRRALAAQQRQALELQHMAMGQQGAYTPTMMGTPTFQPGFAYSNPTQMQQMYQQQQGGYFPQQGMTPMMQGVQGWGTPSPQPMQGPFFGQSSPMQQPMQQYMQQQPPVTQPYGASFDQAQAAARFAQNQAQHPRRG